MKKQLLLFVLMLLPMVAKADAVKINGIYYNLITRTETAKVTGLYRAGDNGAVNIPASVTYDNVTYSVTSIGSYAFRGCSGLTTVTIGNSVTSIEEGAFYWCTNLASITIPNSVTSIGRYAFSNCRSLTTVTIPNSVTSIEEGAFKECTGLTSVTIGNSVTSIGDGAFHSCSGLTSITIPNSVTSIENFAFKDCSGLSTVTIGNSVTSIGEGAFLDCTGLSTVTIGNSVTSIGNYAFEGCFKLSDFYCYAEKVPTTGSDVFKNALFSWTTLHVPAASINAYKAAYQWKGFRTIVALTPEETGVKPITATENPSDRKFMENGRLIIQKNGRHYNAAGQMVKDLSVDSGLRP